ncbi:hypothetical protein Q7C36_015238 [Tachysurus vachellii]|uniref:Uncharacterized protein n=1 Tax=Tachysurus vachellii TaxID=175792 RepID=A0AA88SCP6_TACVA|nr:hypothetical protein Q7C36_015238 [Tachysurus vachellii]
MQCIKAFTQSLHHNNCPRSDTQKKGKASFAHILYRSSSMDVRYKIQCYFATAQWTWAPLPRQIIKVSFIFLYFGRLLLASLACDPTGFLKWFLLILIHSFTLMSVPVPMLVIHLMFHIISKQFLWRNFSG